MTPTRLCIVARPMTRTPRFLLLAATMLVAFAGVGCKELDGRNRNRTANLMFREMQFIDAAAEYEQALKTVDDPIIHYNAGLAYSKIAKGSDKEVLLAEKGDAVCTRIPGTKEVQKRVCVKDGDRRFNECDDKNVCPSSFQCKQATLCMLPSVDISKHATTHFEAWLKANPKDTETEKQMTQVWIDSSQFELALAYWETRLKTKVDDAEIMGNLAGINLKAGNWRKSIEWFTKVAEVSKDTGNKVGAYQFIGNVAWSKLNSKTLGPAETIELADLGLGALQRAAELEPKSAKPVGLQASIFNFRSLAHGASWAAAIDRASAQDLQRASRVLMEEAKKLQGEDPTKKPPAPATPAPPAQASGSAEKTPG
jgi:tetratricopeptide (TPR) repeat protein